MQKKDSLNSDWFGKYGRKVSWIVKRSYYSYLYTCIYIVFQNWEESSWNSLGFLLDYVSRDQIYHFIHLTLRLFSTPQWERARDRLPGVHSEQKKDSLNSELIWKIWKKGKLNSEKIWKMWKKSRLNCEMIWKIWKKIKLNSEKIWKIQNAAATALLLLPLYMYIHCFSELRRIILE
jgi:hypothetical protein